jgi:hypothetical protein
MTSLTRTSLTAAIATLAVLATASASFARPDARTMTCYQTQALIESQGAAVITTGQHTYERFVAHDGYCYHPEVRHITYIDTRDTDQCPVYHCERPIRPFFDD